jgi:hypothetical protein
VTTFGSRPLAHDASASAMALEGSDQLTLTACWNELKGAGPVRTFAQVHVFRRSIADPQHFHRRGAPFGKDDRLGWGRVHARRLF